MTSQKLPSYTRGIICNALLKHRFGEEEEALLENEYALGNSIYEDVFSEQHRALMLQLPVDWLPLYTTVTADFSGHFECLKMGTERPIPSSKTRCALAIYDADHELHSRYEELVSARDLLKARVTTARKQSMAVLNACSTTGRLLAVWPEVEPFIPDILKTGPSDKLPAIPIGQLNEILGLGATK